MSVSESFLAGSFACLGKVKKSEKERTVQPFSGQLLAPLPVLSSDCVNAQYGDSPGLFGRNISTLSPAF